MLGISFSGMGSVAMLGVLLCDQGHPDYNFHVSVWWVVENFGTASRTETTLARNPLVISTFVSEKPGLVGVNGPKTQGNNYSARVESECGRFSLMLYMLVLDPNHPD